jgi:hypothetical protein
MHRCPPFSTSNLYSFMRENCTCINGFYPVYSNTTGTIFECVWRTSPAVQNNMFHVRCLRGHVQKQYLWLIHSSSNSSNPPITDCKPCNPGSWEYEGTCIPCPFGSTSEQGSTYCMCMANSNNTFIDHPLKTCFSSDSDDTYSCSQNHNEVGILDTISKRCTCKPGFYRDIDMSQCVPCLIGFYSSNIGNAPCKPCPTDRPITKNIASTSILQCIPHK